MIRRRPFWVALVLTLAVSLSILPVARAIGDSGALPPTAIRITPPAPAFDNAKRLDELAARRKHVAETIGPKATAVFFSADPRVYTNDVDFPFRQENNLFYLTNLNQKRMTLVLMPAQNPSEILFVPRRSAAAETWTGHMYSPEEAAQLSGVKEIWEASEFDPFIKAVQKHENYQPKAENVLMSARSMQAATAGESGPLFQAADAKQASVYLLANPPS